MIETYTKSQLNSLRKLDRESTTVKRLKQVSPLTEMGQQALEESNKEAFEAYYSLTREIVMVEGKQEILVDHEMIKVANTVMDSHGFHQWRG